VNNTIGIVPAAVPGAVNAFSFSGSFVAWATVGLSWAVAAILLFQMRGARIDALVSSDAPHSSRGEVIV
jgi:hypothetical protein